ncbi:MAG: hypothetical protein GVY19_02515 [Bacteroidetes bacterium]|jgi:sulfite exporter TauE/SafE|nr:hypothetical protein [Bacteroidota bacterium]
MTNEWVLLGTAATVGFVHTITGPDHYLPFAVLAKARKWSYAKTTSIILLCGIGHVGSSVAIGFLGILAGFGLNQLTSVESSRGDIAAWILLLFGLLYMAWGIYKAMDKKHKSHSESPTSKKANLTPWVLFIVFVFGPCEALIPVIIYPGVRENYWLAVSASTVFSIVTIATMLLAVFFTLKGISIFSTEKLTRFSHAAAGLTIFICGLLIVFVGL